MTPDEVVGLLAGVHVYGSGAAADSDERFASMRTGRGTRPVGMGRGTHLVWMFMSGPALKEGIPAYRLGTLSAR